MPPKKPAKADNVIPVAPKASLPDRDENVSEATQRSLDRWTDEQEIALLKAIIRWKPVGMHKHFRIIAIHNYMISQGVVSADDEHTTIAGLWTKLGSLYNLPILDEREDSMLNTSSDENGEARRPRGLAESKGGVGGKLDKRAHVVGGGSASGSPALTHSRRGSTIAETEEAAASPPVSGRRGGRVGKRGGRGSRLAQEWGKRQKTSKAASSTTEDEPMPDVEQGEGDGDGDSDDGDEEQAEESPKPRGSARARGSARGRGGRGGRGRGGTRSRGRRK